MIDYQYQHTYIDFHRMTNLPDNLLRRVKMHIVIRDDKILFGPLKESDMKVVARDPQFRNAGVSALTGREGVDVFVTLPFSGERVGSLRKWYLQNHVLLTQ